MLRKMRDLKGFAIAAKDGDIGEANDCIFDDKNWTVRYLVTKSGPEYDPDGLSRAYEAKLYGHYGEPNYWWC